MNSVQKNSVLENPDRLPLHSVEAIAKSPVLVVAPHPDDECLGCGGAIALLSSLGCRVYILVISDGAMSHPNSQKYPAAKLRSLRIQETQSAMATLGVEASQVSFLGLPDSAVPMSTNPSFGAAVSACQKYLEAIAPQIIFLPWRQDPHADHRATWQMIQAALALQDFSTVAAPRVIEYPIWDWDTTQRGNQVNSEVTKAWRLDIHSVLELKQKAIALYRSQVTNLIDDDPQGFRLSADMLTHFAQPWEVFLEESALEK
ncbi:MAG: PIG-L family deacetylase [Drouetiella hepatica Uher 2000/2452]|jgi:LmbE family N-acetylglucosaminyl deacetylase|uniref:PIG-L family deacetylase n=1 Tax=Drouetiella hepatica Uher 2000/2452 TaxID=904376 RepID=A0A951QFP7_9CYAN|nr:PIG-L family deacetylase [Drouetiella hepatica Uher 2000/2452]